MLKQISSALAASLFLSGCGLRTPEFALSGDPIDSQNLVNAVTAEVKCELRAGLLYVLEQRNIDNTLDFLKDWSAKVTIKLVIDEKTVVNPGLSLITPLHNATTNFAGEYAPTAAISPLTSTVTYPVLSTAQNYAMGLGGQFSSDATRTQTIGYFFVFKHDFLESENDTPAESERKAKINESVRQNNYKCPPTPGKFFLESDLRLIELFEQLGELSDSGMISNSAEISDSDSKTKKNGPRDAKLVNKKPVKKPGQKPPKGPLDVVSHEILFVVTLSGNATPGWKLVRVAANQNSTLFAATRTANDDLLITLGPLDSLKKDQPAQSVTDSHLAAQIGQAVGANNQSQSH